MEPITRKKTDSNEGHVRTLSRQIALGTGLVVLFSCTRDVEAPDVPTAVPTRPAHEILDGAHHGNPHFFFLPPIAPNPTPAGAFDATQSPSVTVCLLVGSACGPTIVAQFSMTSGTASEVVRVDPSTQSYIVNWHTDRCPTGPCTLDPTQVYRIRVLVVNTELGHADVEVVPTKQQAKSLMTGDSVVLVNGTLPVKFRIEQGAVFAVGPSNVGQTVQTPLAPTGSSAQLTLPAGSIPQPVGITALPDTMPTGTHAAALVGGSVYDLGPTGTVFTTPIQVSIHYSLSELPAGVTESTLRLFTYTGNRWVEVPGSSVNFNTHVVTGATGHFSEYAVFGSLEVSANGSVTCASTSMAAGLCWGLNNLGQLATGDFNLRPVPTPISGGIPFSLVVTGQLHACGLSGGSAYCWGINTAGELGTGSLTDPGVTPAAVQGGRQFWSLAVTDGSTCGLSSQDSTAYCWGDNSSDQLGVSGPTLSATPVAVTGNLHFRSLGAGETHLCGIATDGQTYCWGSNGFDQLGDPGAGAARATPSLVIGAPQFVSIAVGANHTCGLDTNGHAWCWGWNSAGQLGNGDDSRNLSAMSATPLEVTTNLHGDSVQFTSLAGGGRHTCGVAVSGGTFCWGRNAFGELGDGSNTWHSHPGPVSGNLALTALTAGFRHTCGITLDGVTYCWGGNESGQLGTGDLDPSTVPSPVVNAALGSQPACGPSTIINANRFTFTLQAGLFPNRDSVDGRGFFDGTQVLFAGGPLFGTDPNHLVLGYDVHGAIPSDITPTNVCVISGPSSQYSFAQLSTTNGPAGIVATQESFAFSGSADAGYILMRYTFRNTGAATVQNFAAGMVMDWDLFFTGTLPNNLVGFDPGLGVGEVSSSGDSHVVGLVPIASSGVVSYRGWGGSPLPAAGGDPQSKAAYFNWLTGGINDSTPPAGDVRELMGVGGLSIAPGDSVVVYIALAGGSNLADFTNSVAAARRMASALSGTLPLVTPEPQTRADYFALLSGGLGSAAPSIGDIREEMGLGPNTIQPGDSLVTYIALVGGEDSTAFAANVQAARSMAAVIGQTAPPATTACSASTTVNENRYNIFLGPGTMAGAAGGPGGSFDGTSVMFAGGLLFGTDGAHLVLGDDVRGAFPTDFIGGNVCTGSTATEQYSIDTLSLRATTVAPPGLLVTQESFAFSDATDNGYVLMRYVFNNVGGAPLNGLYAGMVVDWDLLFDGNAGDDLIQFDTSLGVGEARESNPAVDHHMVGLVPIGPGGISYRGWHQ